MNLKEAKSLVSRFLDNEFGVGKRILRRVLPEPEDPFWKQIQDLRLAAIKSISAKLQDEFPIAPSINGIRRIYKYETEIRAEIDTNKVIRIQSLTTDELVWIEQRII